MKRKIALLAALALVAAAVVLGVGPSYSGHSQAKAFDPTTAPEIQDRLLDGYASMAFGLGNSNENNSSSNEQPPNQYFPRGSNTCSQNISSNIKVNQNCLNLSDPNLQGRSQAENETSIQVNPQNPQELLAASNDYRLGDGGCFPAYSRDGGRTWNDTTLPYGFVRGRAFGAARQYWQTCGDPFVIGYDTYGNAYFGGLMFNRGTPTTNNPDFSSGVYVYRSTQNDGASWNFPGRPVTEDYDATGATLQDKPYGTIDNNTNACAASVTTVQAGSTCTPFQNRIYVTWTDFASDGTAYIFESYSSDYGEHFSQPHLVSVNSPVLCANTYGLPAPNGNCNENQFSNPFVGPDGTLYVVYNNYNNALKNAQDNENNILLSYSTDGGNTFQGPILVGNYYDLPDCATYQGGKDVGRACVPEKGSSTNSYFRATNYPVGSVNPTNPNQVVVTYGSYINQHSNESNGCIPAGTSPATGDNLYTGVKTPGACNNDIIISVSNDHGNTFTGTTQDPRTMPVVTQDPGQATTDQFWQWQAFTKNGKLAVSYYDRQYGTDETTGFSDYSLSGSSSLVKFNTTRVTSSSNPPPTEFSGLFMGDYSGLAAYTNANPLWTDTRNPELFACLDANGNLAVPPSVCTATAPSAPASPLNDQDIYTANVSVPSP
ncbi:MAG TPA: sialidase family protein [Gaiellaceae bacterium]|nr:sialidase family protein [Gaiellaceae bacterium]